MEQQAKERLTGGVILVVLLVLLVPELLAGPETAPAPVPAQPDQAPMRSYTMELGESAHGREPVAPSTAAPAASVMSPASSAPAPVRTAAATAPVAAPPRPTEAAPAPRPAATAAQTRGTGHANPLWTVQLGTFSNRENAARLALSLKSHGFSASLSEATRNGHKLFRVRVGAERDRAAAQKLLGRLKAAGAKGGDIVPR